MKPSKFLIFIGTPRSGHSIVGALLDAHPHAVISHELDALEQIERGVSGQALLDEILKTSQQQAKEGRGQGKTPTYRFDYSVPGQWQGTFDQKLDVIGDKKGGGSTTLLKKDPLLLKKLADEVQLPIYILHIVRNPFDNIATMARRASTGLEVQIERYRLLYEQIDKIFKTTYFSVLQCHHEELIASPEKELRVLCEWLGLEPHPAWLEACSSILYPNPHTSRELVEWNEANISDVKELIECWPILHRYRDVVM